MQVETVLENTITGETKLVHGNAFFTPPWIVKEVRKTGTAVLGAKASIAVKAQKMGLPVATFLDAARWLLKKDCPFCQLGTQVLRAMKELGEEQAEAFITQILVAKEQNDTAELERIRQRIWSSEQPE